MGKFLVRPLRWWAESATTGGNRVKGPENLGATTVVPVAPVDTFLVNFKTMALVSYAIAADCTVASEKKIGWS